MGIDKKRGTFLAIYHVLEVTLLLRIIVNANAVPGAHPWPGPGMQKVNLIAPVCLTIKAVIALYDHVAPGQADLLRPFL